MLASDACFFLSKSRGDSRRCLGCANLRGNHSVCPPCRRRSSGDLLPPLRREVHGACFAALPCSLDPITLAHVLALLLRVTGNGPSAGRRAKENRPAVRARAVGCCTSGGERARADKGSS